jgi:hypothetical protein
MRAALQWEKPKWTKKFTSETPFGAQNDPADLRKENPSSPGFQAFTGAPEIV